MDKDNELLTEEQIKNVENINLKEDLWIELIDTPLKLAKSWLWDLVQTLE